MLSDHDEYLPKIVDSYKNLQKIFLEAQATQSISFTKEIPNTQIIPQKIPCIIEDIPGNLFEQKITLPASSIQLLFEEIKSIVTYLFVKYKMAKNMEESYSMFYQYIDIKQDNKPEQKNGSNSINFFSSTIFVATLMTNAIKNESGLPEGYYAKYIRPLIEIAKKIKEFQINNVPCCFRSLKENPTEIYQIEEVSPQGSMQSIGSIIKSIIDSISNKENYSLNILDSVIGRVRQFNAEIKRRNILKTHENLLSSICQDQIILSDFPALLTKQGEKPHDEESIIQIAYTIALAGLNLALIGVGKNSNIELDFYGATIYPNNANMNKTIFALNYDNISKTTLNICREIQQAINEPFFYREYENLLNLKNKNEKEKIQNIVPYLQALSTKYKEVLEKTVEKYEKDKNELQNLIVSLADELKFDETVESNNNNDNNSNNNDNNGNSGNNNGNQQNTKDSFLNKLKKFFNKVLPTAVQAVIKTYNLYDKYHQMLTTYDFIENLKSKKGLISWIEQIPMIMVDESIIGIRVEQNGEKSHITAINSAIELV